MKFLFNKKTTRVGAKVKYYKSPTDKNPSRAIIFAIDYGKVDIALYPSRIDNADQIKAKMDIKENVRHENFKIANTPYWNF